MKPEQFNEKLDVLNGSVNLLLDEFKDGAFRIAIEHQLTIIPITFYDNKKRFSSYCGLCLFWSSI